MTRNLFPALLVTALIGTVVAANYATSSFGLVTALLPGLLVTAGTYFAGLGLALRDGLHELGGVRWCLAAIAVGIALSAVLGDGRIALASAVAFGLAELIDLAVYAPLHRAGRRRLAVIASGAVGAVVDTFAFLAVAGFPITVATVVGQFFVKAVVVTAVYLLAREGVRRAVLRERFVAAGA